MFWQVKIIFGTVVLQKENKLKQFNESHIVSLVNKLS